MKKFFNKRNILLFCVLILISLVTLGITAGNSKDKLFIETGKSVLQRSGNESVMLKDGRVLIVGGSEKGSLYDTNTAELYDPKTGKFTKTGKMTERRQDFTATLLKDGRVLVVGGQDISPGAARIKTKRDRADLTFYSAEIYDSKTGKFINIPNSPIIKYDTVIYSHKGPKNLNFARSMHTATLLNDGRVLIAGGFYPYYDVKQAEIFDPQTNKFYLTGSLNEGRSYHTATLLKDGRVLIVGGAGGDKYIKPTEIYDPNSRKFTITDKTKYKHGFHTATLLKDGEVLIIGGSSNNIAEIYDPPKQKFTEVIKTIAYRSQHTATLLNNGEVLVIGASTISRDFSTIGPNFAEIYNPKTNKFHKIENPSSNRLAHTANLLQNGNVLIYGGGIYNKSHLPNELFIYKNYLLSEGRGK